MRYVGEGPWWPIKKPQQRKKEKSERLRGRDVRSSLFILDLKDGKL